MPADLVACQDELRRGKLWRRRDEELRARTHRLALGIDDDPYLQLAAMRAVALVVRRVEHRHVPLPVWVRTVNPKRLANLRIDEANPEMTFGGNLHPFVLRDAHDAAEVTREDPVESGLWELGVWRRWRLGLAGLCQCGGGGEAKDFARLQRHGA